jgi:serine/threonine protein kinase
VDFGTAKDIVQTDLNGQEFVGTAEYMCPETVKVKGSLKVGIEADIWALGITLYQMIFGITPFQAPSPFLTFLRIKRGRVVVSNSCFPQNFLTLKIIRFLIGFPRIFIIC